MQYRLVAPPSVEPHSANVLRLFVRDANRVPVAAAHVKVWAGPPPFGNPTYLQDEYPFRLTNSSGLIEYYAFDGAMPEARDYWMQIVAPDGSAQSDAIQFHFDQGSGFWITAILQDIGSVGSPITPTPIDVQWDSRLTAMHVSVQGVGNLLAGQSYWKLVSAQYQDESQSGGNHNLYYTVLDERGLPIPGIPIVLDWEGRDPADVPSLRYTDGNGKADFGLYGGPSIWNPGIQPGPYVGWVGDPDLRGRRLTGIPGERLTGVGLPLNHHVNFVATWRRVTVSASPASSSVGGTISNAPAGIVVLLSGTATQSVAPDAAGRYLFSGLAAGTYAIAITGVGTVRSGVSLDGTSNVQVDYSFAAPPKRNSRVLGNVQNAPANCQLMLTSGRLTFNTKVDNSGNYAFTGLPAGTFSLSFVGVGVVTSNLVLDGSNTVTFNFSVTPPQTGKLIAHYLLFGSPKLPATRTNLILALDYISCFGPTVGFSVEEAKTARNVTIVGAGAISAANKQALVGAGCQVRHFEGADSYAMEELFAAQIAAGNPYPGSG